MEVKGQEFVRGMLEVTGFSSKTQNAQKHLQFTHTHTSSFSSFSHKLKNPIKYVSNTIFIKIVSLHSDYKRKYNDTHS